MFTTKYGVRSWRRDLSRFISWVWRGEPGKVRILEPNATNTVKLECKSVRAIQSWLGPSLFVKGEISGKEDLIIDGSVEGVVRLSGQRLLVGAAATVKADVMAGEVVISGSVKGNVRARGRIVIRNDGSVTGDLTTPQVFIENGAWFKGSVEIEKRTGKETEEKTLSDLEPTPERVTAVAAGVKGT